jgi:hypothetical protein
MTFHERLRQIYTDWCNGKIIDLLSPIEEAAEEEVKRRLEGK